MTVLLDGAQNSASTAGKWHGQMDIRSGQTLPGPDPLAHTEKNLYFLRMEFNRARS
jgi:hypothetical protein